jgi:hypothetical protein
MYSWTPKSKRLETFLSVCGISVAAVVAGVSAIRVASFVQLLMLLILDM